MIFVVTKHVGRLMEQENVCVTKDVGLAVDEMEYVYHLEDAREAFIEVWEDGELDYVTREDPRKL